MSEPIKIKDTEMQQIKDLQTKYQEMILRLGNLKVEQMELDRLVNDFVEKEKKVREDWTLLQQKEKEVLDSIVKTYGEGSLNLADGTFTPSSNTQKV